MASFSPVKDHGTLLAAFAILAERQPGAHLHLVGEGPLEPEIGRRIRALDLGARVELHGAVDHGQLAGFYRQADLLVQSSRFESQGLAVLEAVACGCPVVGTGVGVVPELCPANLVTTPGDADGLAETMSAVVSDPGRRQRLVKTQAEVVRDFALPVTVERLRGHLADLVAPEAQEIGQ